METAARAFLDPILKETAIEQYIQCLFYTNTRWNLWEKRSLKGMNEKKREGMEEEEGWSTEK